MDFFSKNLLVAAPINWVMISKKKFLALRIEIYMNIQLVIGESLFNLILCDKLNSYYKKFIIGIEPITYTSCLTASFGQRSSKG